MKTDSASKAIPGNPIPAVMPGWGTLIYEGNDEPNSTNVPNPKLVDQPEL
jgi:hypothetical protein